ncbi:hypothetical protein WOLCODRAFT_29156 [Wolfiporia cocos MD-104 SS10]|uniref:SHSP domain-containing protein n=1 Tax=Wolfiporia cocos (strain MD-104) TaxID=742152 RepID=A0A2H3J5N6_WOLCO|nr:hypothetical protein WOLCODRAFT_29156 [Wolfiporia cocos MD-104 SS10]
MARLQQTPSNDEQRFRNLERTLARTFLRELLRRRSQPSAVSSPGRTYQPRMDLYDDPSYPWILATLELPGLKQEDISVRIEDNQLIVQGERRFANMGGGPHGPSPPDEHIVLVPGAAVSPMPRGYAVHEIKYGVFRREIGLPLGTQARHVQASLSEGMLKMSWPRNPQAEPFPTDRLTSGAEGADSGVSSLEHAE